MADRVLQFTATIPAGTPPSAPVTEGFELDGWDIEHIELQVLAGPLGVLGFYLANNGVPWIPRTPGEWLIWDDHTEAFYSDSYPTASGWEVVAYNTGTFEHAVITRFHVNPLTPGPAAGVALPVVTFVEHGVKDNPVVL